MLPYIKSFAETRIKDVPAVGGKNGDDGGCFAEGDREYPRGGEEHPCRYDLMTLVKLLL